MIDGLGQGCGGPDAPPARHFQPGPGWDPAIEWIPTFSALGAKYAVYVAKHGCGFCAWPTKAKPPNGTTYPYVLMGMICRL